jgi:hypothetical protein
MKPLADLHAPKFRHDEASDFTPILVQTRDEAGFWVNVSECRTVEEALRTARYEASETGQGYRVTRGKQRIVVQEFGA